MDPVINTVGELILSLSSIPIFMRSLGAHKNKRSGLLRLLLVSFPSFVSLKCSLQTVCNVIVRDERDGKEQGETNEQVDS